MIGRTLSHYRITSELGAGGMGVVYRAHDEALDREVAVKVLPSQFAADPQRRARFEREARAAARLSHPGIVQIHDFGVEEGVAYAVSELVEGRNLRQHLAGGALPWRQAIGAASQIAAALAAAHEKGIVHRDLKPENVMVDASGRLKVLDFGLARILEQGPASGTQATVSDSLTGAGTILGTVGYMAPEQLRGQEVDARADVFAFGCLLYEMLTGRRAFGGESQADTISAILNSEPPPVANLATGLPPALDLLVRRCLQKRKEDRFSSAHDVLLALESASSDLGAQAPPPPAAPRRRTRRLAAIAGVIAVAAVAIAFLAGRGGRAPAPTEPRPAAPAAAAAVEQGSIAVLPFSDLSAARDQEYFADGLTEELLNVLAKLPELRVASRTSSFAFKGKQVPVDSIARALHVANVLEGSVRKDAGRIRITAQLVNAANGYHVWSETYDRDAGSVFAVQDEIARAIVSALELKLGGGRAAAALAKEETEDAEAHTLLLKAIQLARSGENDALLESNALAERAIARDPSYARAYAVLSRGFTEMSYRRLAPRGEMEAKARSAAAKAIALDPLLGEAHVALGEIAREFELDWKEGEAHYARALELDPGNSSLRSRRAWMLSQLGRLDESIAEAKRASEMDPLSSGMHSNLGAMYLADRQYERAIDSFEASLALQEHPIGLVNLALTYALMGEDAKAMATAERMQRVSPDDQFVIGTVAYIHARAGRRAEAERLLRQVEAMPEPSAYLLASIRSALGDRDGALASLEKALQEKDTSLMDLGVDPVFADYQDEPRVKALLVKMGLR